MSNPEAPWLGVVCLVAALLVGAGAMLAFHADAPAIGGCFLVVTIALLGATAVNVSDEE